MSENLDEKSENLRAQTQNEASPQNSGSSHNFEDFKAKNFGSEFFDGSKSEKSEKKSDKSDKKSDNSDKKSEKSDKNPDSSDKNSEKSDKNSDESDKNSEKSDKNSDKSEYFDDFVENLENSAENVEKDDPNLEDKLLVEKLRKLELEMTETEKIAKKSDAENLKILGNTEFKNENFEKSAEIYTQALEICPLCYQNDRAILYANRAASNLKLELDQKALEDCNRALELYPDYFKALLRRAKILEKLEKYEEALEDYKKLNLIQPENSEVKHSLFVLPKKIEERNEKLKEEMLGKLKDLGNMILRPFGLSTSNFQVNQDPNSGGYSINFQQNKPN